MTENNQTQSAPRKGIFARLGAPQVPPPWSLGEMILVLVALAMTMILVASTIAILINGEMVNISAQALLTGWIIGLLMTGAFVWVRFRRDEAMQQALRLVPVRTPVALLLLIGVALGLALNVIAGLGSGFFRPVAALSYIQGDTTGEWLVAMLFLVVAQPLVETLVFFGVVLPRLRAQISPYAGLVMTIALFTVLHVGIYSTQVLPNDFFWYGVLWPVLLAFTLATVRINTSSTLATMIVYIGVGLSTFLIALTM